MKYELDELGDLVIKQVKIKSKSCADCGEKSILPYGLHIFNECKFWKIVENCENCEDLDNDKNELR